MKKTLLPYQEAGVRFLSARYHALIADEPGLGKTLQAIGAVEVLGLKNVLVVAPASVRLNWTAEIEACLGSSYGWQVISYQGASSPAILRHVLPQYDAIILDEVHFVKTPSSQRCQAIFGNEKGLARRARYIWGLSGTPILNRPVELWPMLKSLHPAFASMSYTAYTQKYCAAFFDGRGVNVKGASRLDELSSLLQGFMLRRTKAEVLPELPPKRISRVPLEITPQEFKAVMAEEELIGARESKLSSVYEDFSALGDMSRLLRLTGEAKVRAASEFIDDLLGTTDKVVVFAKHREVIRELERRLALRGHTSSVYHGGMSDAQKAEAVRVFQSETSQVFIGQIAAAGTGINGLQGVCNHVVFAELSWVPGEVGQAVDRLHRIGQTRDSVNVYMLHVPGTLESAVLGVHDAKSLVIERLMQDDVLQGLL